ncbi:MAG: glycosyltransferase family 4 protein [Elusimicrobia bacterium]|nr:glycosyltransferase family 4 protein [Elusimicrobiota bacterium]
MKKVAIIITKLELGGAQKIALSLCKNIDKNKFKTVLICGCGGILDDEARRDTQVFFVKDLIRELNPIKDLKAFFTIYKILKREKPDIVHTHSSKAGILGRIAAKLTGTKCIIHAIHGFAFNDYQSKLKKYFYIFLEKICAKISDILIVECEQTKLKGLKYNIGTEKQYKKINLGVDLSEFTNYSQGKKLRKELSIKDDEILVSTVGPFKPQKNLSDFIKIASCVTKSNKKIKFAIAGDGDLRKDLEKLIKDLNLENSVFLLGWRRDIPNILYSSDIFLMTSLWEGMPVVSINALYCGLPMVVNAVDGQIDLINDGINGYLIKPFDINNAAKKVLLLASDKTLREKISSKAKTTIDETYSTKHMITQHEELYNGKTN